MGDTAQISDLVGVFNRAVSFVIPLAGIVLFIMLFVGGFQYATAGEDPQKTEAAKKILTSAIAGLVLIVMAYLILTLIAKFALVNPNDLLEFKVTQSPPPQ